VFSYAISHFEVLVAFLKILSEIEKYACAIDVDEEEVALSNLEKHSPASPSYHTHIVPDTRLPKTGFKKNLRLFRIFD